MELERKTNILGTEYTLRYGNKSQYAELETMDGFVDTSQKLIIVDLMEDCTGIGFKKDMQSYRKRVARHEVIHAFLFESGLSTNSASTDSWSSNEEMVDWFAIQFPKILKSYDELRIL